MAYFNAGTDGPLPAAAVAAARAALGAQETEGRTGPHFERRIADQESLRDAYAALLGAEPSQVAVTASTSEGLALVLAGLGLGAGDEIVTSDQEHPGLIGPLIAARRRGVSVRTAPLTQIASAVTAATTLVACSHVGWLHGDVVDPAIGELDIPVVLDGAQGAGAVPIDLAALGCDAYAAAGQKWCCGADGTGMLYLSPAMIERVEPLAPGYLSFVHHDDGLDSPLHDDARRHQSGLLPRETVAMSLAAMQVVSEYGWDAIHARARELAQRLVDALHERGRTVAARGDTTLVSFEADDPLALRETFTAGGVVLRNLPGTPYVRASVGAWNDEDDLDRLLALL